MTEVAFYNPIGFHTGERLETLPTFQTEEWNERRVLSWLKGIDDSVLPFMRCFQTANLNGQQLLLCEEAELIQLSVKSSYVRNRVLNGIRLLAHYSYNLHSENIQKIAFLIVGDVNYLMDAIVEASPVIESFNNGTNKHKVNRLTSVLNNVLMCFSRVYEHVKKLVFWLDRSPFENIQEYITIRDKITELILEMLDAVNPHNRRFMPISEVLHERGMKMKEICDQLVYSDDPWVLCSANLAYAFIRNAQYKGNCGIIFQTVFGGINLITGIKPDSPAAVCKNIRVGDEILEINGECVIGWKFENVQEKLLLNFKNSNADSKSVDLKLLLSRRPAEEGAGMLKSKTSEALVDSVNKENRTKLELDFSLKIEPDMFTACADGSRRSLNRRRSSSFTLIGDSGRRNPDRLSIPLFNSSNLLGPNAHKRSLNRRASVWSDSPPSALVTSNKRHPHGLESKALSHLLDCWKEPTALSATVLRLPKNRRSNKSPSKLTDGNHNCVEGEDQGEYVKVNDIEFAQVEVVQPAEIESLNLATISTQDPEWNSPVQEITGLTMTVKNVIVELAGGLPDSPLSAAFTKFSRFWNGDTGSQSMSTSYSDRGDCSNPSTPVSRHAIEKIIPRHEKHKSLPPPTTSTPESTPLTSRYSTIKARHRLAPLAEPENDDETTDGGEDVSFIEKSPIYFSSRNSDRFRGTPRTDLKNCSKEGWLRRQRLAIDSVTKKNKKPSQWVKSWIVIVDEKYLLSYSNNLSLKPDIVIELDTVHLHIGSHGLKTTKKFVFALSSGTNSWLHFAPYSLEDYNGWISQLTHLVLTVTKHPGSSEFYLTLNARSEDSADSAVPQSPANNSTTRGFFNTHRFISSLSRHGSLSTNDRQAPTGTDAPDHQSGSKTSRL